MWGALLGTIASQAGNLLPGGGKEAPITSGGYVTSGNKTDTRQEPITDPDGPKSFMEKTNNFLGSDTGRLATNIGGQFLSDFRQRRNSRNRFDDLKEEGLTATEIAGGGGGAGGVQAQGTTLGSGPATTAKNQQDFMADQAEAERDNKIKIAQIQSGPAYEQAYLKGSQVELEKLLFGPKLEQAKQQVKILESEAIIRKIEAQDFYDILYSKMSQQNMIAAMAAKANGIPAKRILSSEGGPATAEEIKAMTKAGEFANKFSGCTGEGYGVLGAGRDIIERGKDTVLRGAGKGIINTLGRFVGK